MTVHFSTSSIKTILPSVSLVLKNALPLFSITASIFGWFSFFKSENLWKIKSASVNPLPCFLPLEIKILKKI